MCRRDPLCILLVCFVSFPPLPSRLVDPVYLPASYLFHCAIVEAVARQQHAARILVHAADTPALLACTPADGPRCTLWQEGLQRVLEHQRLQFRIVSIVWSVFDRTPWHVYVQTIKVARQTLEKCSRHFTLLHLNLERAVIAYYLYIGRIADVETKMCKLYLQIQQVCADPYPRNPCPSRCLQASGLSPIIPQRVLTKHNEY
jgi:hypothetical protein